MITKIAALMAALTVSLAAPGWAQVGSGALTGVVADSSGAALPAASVTARAVATGLVRGTVTSVAGNYVVQGLAPGAYEVQITLAGFRPHIRTGLQVATGETLRVDVTLDVGATDTVTVLSLIHISEPTRPY